MNSNLPMLRKFCLKLLLSATFVCPMALWGQQSVQFPFPEIPTMLTQPQERLVYMLEHFWDNYHFQDTTLANQTVAEQGFSDFVNLMQYADSAQASRAADIFVRKAFATGWGRGHYEQLADHYLGNPESPLRNDIVYAHLLRSMVPAYPKTDVRKTRVEYRLRMVSKNQVGSPAADFRFVSRQGRQSTLYQTVANRTLLIFNDPDCEHCQEMMPRLLSHPALRKNGLTVIAIYPDSDTSLWKKQVRQVPANWVDAYSPKGEIMSRQLYHLPAMPSMYLLDAKKRVLVKDGTLDAIVKALNE